MDSVCAVKVERPTTTFPGAPKQSKQPRASSVKENRINIDIASLVWALILTKLSTSLSILCSFPKYWVSCLDEHHSDSWGGGDGQRMVAGTTFSKLSIIRMTNKLTQSQTNLSFSHMMLGKPVAGVLLPISRARPLPFWRPWRVFSSNFGRECSLLFTSAEMYAPVRCSLANNSQNRSCQGPP